MDYKSIANKLIELKNADLEFRQKLVQSGQLGEGYNKEMEVLHISNAEQLSEIIDTIGYPTIDKVGKEANEASWLIIQHSISRPAFMKKCAQLLKLAVAEKKANSIDLVYLTDRIAVFEEQPQLYGTQFDWDENGVLCPNPFDDLTKVNERRKSLGLNTLEEQTEKIREQAKTENHLPPPDFEKRQQELKDWKRKVGWIK
nr:DUF6624 domain-containing protein [uncultured Draconibacterium sp.]